MRITPHIAFLKGSVDFGLKITAALLCALYVMIAPTSMNAALRYWDINGTTSGAGGATPSGTWVTGGSNWSSNTGGTIGTTWGANDTAIFSAGTDATGSYTVTLSGTVNADNITVQEGTPIIAGNGLSLKQNAIIDVASGASITFSGTISTGNTFSKSGAGSLNFTTAQNFSGTTFNVSGGTLSMTGTSSIGTLNITADTVLDFTGTLNLTVTNLNLTGGANLYITNYAGSDTFSTTNFNGSPAAVTSYSVFFNGVAGANFGSGSITPAPEPATYGALLMASSLGAFAFVRRRRA